MDVTPHELRTAEFREAWRGYRHEDVDELLDRAALTVERLQGQVERLSERLARVEEEAGLGREADEMLRRTLLLAQRTADAAVSEARERAQRLTSEAEARAQAIVSEAREEAQRVAAAERERLETELRDLAERRDLLLEDVEALERFAEEHRRRLRSFFEAELASLDARVPSTPDRPALHAPALDDVVSGTGPHLVAVPVPEERGEASEDAERSLGAPLSGVPDEAEPLEADLVEVTGSPDARVGGEGDLADEEADFSGPEERGFVGRGAGADLLPRRDPDDGWGGEAEPFDEPGVDDDTFFRQLREAVEDETPLGPTDPEASEDGIDGGEPEDWAPQEELPAPPRAVLFDQDAPEHRGLRAFRRRG